MCLPAQSLNRTGNGEKDVVKESRGLSVTQLPVESAMPDLFLFSQFFECMASSSIQGTFPAKFEILCREFLKW